MNTESDSGDDTLAEGQTLKMSPDQMQALLAAGSQGVTRELRGWHPPSVEALQKMLPQYEIAEFIARGGMGAVYKGVQRALDRTVAIKILPPDIVEDGEANYAQRFKQEARAMAKFKHPGIVTVYDAGETPEGLLYFVMEFIEGTDVAHLVATHGQLPPEQAIRITTAVCDALAYAHARGVVHRDIKPSNIMIDADGQVKVADFGLAKITTHEPGGITKSSVTMGTPDFVAPEAMIAGALVDQRADLYAVGVMLYQMLTGQIPRGRFSPISDVVPKSDPKLDAIVDKAMQTDREKRYSSAVEMKTDVEKVATRSGGLQPPSSFTAPAVANRRSLKLLALAAAVIVLGAGGWMMWKNLDGILSASSSSTAIGTATKDAPFMNTLGMKFVPVPITGGPTDKQRVLFSIWETRVQDYEAFVNDTKREWPKPNFAQGPTHPAVMVSWEDAAAFCAWLTDKERKAGKIGAADVYRLPSDHEWSCAVGIGDRENSSQPPSMKQEKITGVYPWGTDWPPLLGAGNHHDETALKKDVSPEKPALAEYDDGWAWTAPVGTFPANSLGLFDLSGNASEWCDDWIGETTPLKSVRGGEYAISERKNMLSSYRMTGKPDQRYHTYGFRVVLAPVASTTTTGPHWPHMPTEVEKKQAFTNSLGMKFVPVPGTEVLFCIHETRKADYAAYAAAVPGVDATWRQPAFYRDTPVSPTPDHPVVWVSPADAQGFCTWLTEKEGRKYRLPSDYEWSCAVGIAEREDREALPTARGAQFVPDFAWGTDWPPPKGAGNIGDETLKRVTGQEPVITGYDDGFATTAPVMSFPPNALGIHDLAGNVWEWCPDWFDSLHKHLVRRGSSYDNGHPAPQRAYVAACVRNPSPTDHRSEDGGFRIVAER